MEAELLAAALVDYMHRQRIAGNKDHFLRPTCLRILSKIQHMYGHPGDYHV